VNTAPGDDELIARNNFLRVIGSRVPPTPVPERPRDWLDDLDDLLADDPQDKPAPASAAAPRLPDWRRGETADLTKPPATDEPTPQAADEQLDDDPEPADELDPAPGPKTAPAEPHWDFRRLRHWPYARPAIGAGLALLPFFHGQSAATQWGSTLIQARAQAGVSAAWVIASVGFTVAAILVRRHRSWWTYSLLTSAFIGTVAMASPLDLVRFVTGAF
jgi:hypothetical protein